MIVALLFSAALMADPAAQAAAPRRVARGRSAGEPDSCSAAKTAKADPDRVCKLEPMLGSKITKKVCYNRAQMAERTFYDKQNLDLIQDGHPHTATEVRPMAG